MRGVLFWGVLLAVPGDWWLDLLSGVGTVAFRIAFVVRKLRGLSGLQEFEVSLFANKTASWVSFYYVDEA